MKIRSVGIIMLALAFSTLAGAQQFKRSVAASGGGHSESAFMKLDGTVGQVCIGRSSSSSNHLQTGFWTGGAVVAPPTCDYMQGDISGDGQRLGSDVTYGVRYFKGVGTVPKDSCFLDSTGTYLYVGGDVNGNCEFRGSDITRLVQYFKGNAVLSYCHFFPPPIARVGRISLNQIH
jgi:hypothetical protein